MTQEGGNASDTPLDREDVLALVRRFQSTKERADFEPLFRRYHPDMVLFLRKRGFSEPEAEDLAQDAMMRMWQKIDLFDCQEGANFDAWVRTLLGNLWKNHLRSLQTAGRTADRTSLEAMAEAGPLPEAAELPGPHAFPKPPPHPEAEALKNERHEQVRRAVATLPPRMRLALGYRLDQGMTYADIAQTMGVTLGTIRSQISTAYSKLRDLLGPPFDKLDDGDE